MLKKLFGGKDDEFSFETPKPTIDSCPYCGFEFDKIPTRKKKCPECENYVFVRSGNLYTEEEKNIKDWLDNYTIQELVVTRDIFNKTRQELNQEFGLVASVNDTLWKILNRTVAQDKSLTHKKMAYQAMAIILEDEGKNTDEVLAQAHKMELMEGKIANRESAKAFRKELLEVKELNDRSGIHMVVKINTCNDNIVCDACKNLSKMSFSVDEALEIMPIPNKCANASCRCTYVFQLPDLD